MALVAWGPLGVWVIGSLGLWVFGSVGLWVVAYLGLRVSTNGDVWILAIVGSFVNKLVCRYVTFTHEKK